MFFIIIIEQQTTFATFFSFITIKIITMICRWRLIASVIFQKELKRNLILKNELIYYCKRWKGCITLKSKQSFQQKSNNSSYPC